MKKITNLFAAILLTSFVIITSSCNKDDFWYAGDCTVKVQLYYTKSGITDTAFGNASYYITKGNTTCPENPTKGYNQMGSNTDGGYTYTEMSKGDYYIYVEYTDSLGIKYTGGEHVEVAEEDQNITQVIFVQ